MNPIPLPFQIVDGRKVMKRQDWSRLRYRVQRYLSYLTNDELNQRLIDIFTNMMTLTEEGQLSPPVLGTKTPFDWTELFGQMLEEYGLRGEGLPSGFMAKVDLPKPTAPGPAKGVRELNERGINAAGKLVKYGNQAWLKESYLTGRWQVSPATAYDSTDLCNARKDTEMELRVHYPLFERHPECGADVFDECMPDRLRGIQHTHVKAHTNFYLACFSRTMRYRLFDDFNADSCLVVMDEELFKAKMMNAFADFRPRWKGTYRSVEYVDPHLPPQTIDVFFSKHLRYSYQEEFRFVWKPSPYASILQPVFVDLGTLKDCCEFVPLSLLKAA